MPARKPSVNEEALVNKLIPQIMRRDGWVNALTALGVAGRDKTIGAAFTPDELTHEQCEDLWTGDDMAARVIETLPAEMMRQGYCISVDPGEQAAAQEMNRGEKSDAEKVLQAKLDDLQADDSFLKALEYERAYGGGAILLGADDGNTNMSQPLNVDTIKSIDWLNVLMRRELIAGQWYADSTTKKFGLPMTYTIQPDAVSGSIEVDNSLNQVVVHESRLIIFYGSPVSRRRMQKNQGWGDSVLIRCNKVLSQFGQTWGGAAILLSDFAQAVIKIKGLAELLAATSPKKVIDRAVAVDLARSIARAVIIDSEEEYERKATPLTGLPEMLDKFALRLSAAAGMPVSLLMGQAPAGLNATGDSDIRFFYDRVKSLQNKRLRPAMERLIKLLFLSKTGPTKGVEPVNWSIKFASLWQPTETQTAEIRLKQAQTDEIYLRQGVVSPEEIAVSRFGGDGYSHETTIDIATREAALEVPEGTTAPGTTPSNDPTEAARNEPKIPITPTDFASIVKVNEVRVKAGYGPLTTESGAPDPDGNLTVSQFQAKHASTVATANAATSGETSPTPPAVPNAGG
jgi:phage-related protein (TIGR01555 family)